MAWPALLAAAALIVGAGGAAPVAHADPPDNTVTVQGEGIVSAPPDTAVVRLGVQVQAASVADARGQSAAAAQAVIAAAKADGVADQDIQTVQLTINPVYNTVSGQQVLTGYRAENVLQIKVRNLNNAGQVIDDAAAAGGNATIVQGIAFTIDDPSPLAHQARLLAIQDAQNKANDYATAVGLTVGRAVQIIEQTSPAPPPVPLAAPAAAASVGTPVQGGTLQVKVDVTVSFLLQ
ncbi:MAG TPA: SIMPL domain-containing protein [Dehalococcoidia bacterium]|nr:SIMPL domain-containing protein [Dehalococcoidia bacterium]